MRDACDRTVHWGLVALIVFTPLAFGTVEAWSIALMEWGIVTLGLIFLLSRLWRPDRPDPGNPSRGGPVALWPVAVPMGLFLLLVVLQMVPLPLAWLKVVSPGSARMYASVDFGTWENPQDLATGAGSGPMESGLRLERPARRPISVNPERTRARLVQLGALMALFLLVAHWANGPRAVSILKAVIVVGFVVSVFGLVQLLTWNDKIYWVRKIPNVSATTPTAFGPFVNHDHFAGYVEMIIPLALCLAFWLVERDRVPAFLAPGGGGAEGRSASLRPRTLEERGRLSQGTLAVFATVILIVALFFSLSRGGILSAFISGSLLWILLCRRIASRLVRMLVAVALPAVVVSVIGLIGAEAVKKQMGTYANLSGEASFQLRAIIWQRLIRELPAYAWVGSGLGTFEDSFAPITPAGSQRRWDKAHNDYLHLVWETGLAGGALFALGAAVFVRRFWWPALRGGPRAIDLFGLGMAVSLLSIALHSAVDFSLQIGANGFLCALLAGLMVALRKEDAELPSGRVRGPAVELRQGE